MARITPVFKMFGGHKYLLKHQVYSREQANNLCRQYKGMGYLTRVVKDKRKFPDVTGTYPVYGVYVRGAR